MAIFLFAVCTGLLNLFIGYRTAEAVVPMADEPSSEGDTACRMDDDFEQLAADADVVSTPEDSTDSSVAA